MLFQTGKLPKSLALSLRRVKSRVARESNFIGETVPRGTRDFRTFVTPDSDPGACLSRVSQDRVRVQDHGQDRPPYAPFWHFRRFMTKGAGLDCCNMPPVT